MPFCSRNVRMVSPIFMLGFTSTDLVRGWLHSNQSSTVWQAEFHLCTTSDIKFSPEKSPRNRALTRLFVFQVGREKIHSFLPRVCRIVRSVSLFIVRILETMSGVRIDRDFDFFAELLERLFKLFHILGRDPMVLRAK